MYNKLMGTPTDHHSLEGLWSATNSSLYTLGVVIRRTCGCVYGCPAMSLSLFRYSWFSSMNAKGRGSNGSVVDYREFNNGRSLLFFPIQFIGTYYTPLLLCFPPHPPPVVVLVVVVPLLLLLLLLVAVLLLYRWVFSGTNTGNKTPLLFNFR